MGSPACITFYEFGNYVNPVNRTDLFDHKQMSVCNQDIAELGVKQMWASLMKETSGTSDMPTDIPICSTDIYLQK